MPTTIVASEGVNLVDNDRFDATECFRGLRAQEKEQRFRGGDEYVGRFLELTPSVARRGVSRSDVHSNLANRLADPIRSCGASATGVPGNDKPMSVYVCPPNGAGRRCLSCLLAVSPFWCPAPLP